MLGQFTGQQETDSSLDFAAGDGRPLVVVGQTGRLGSDALEDVIDEAVHDAHGFGRDTGVGMHLLQDFVDVDSIAFLPLALLLLVSLSDVLRCLAGLLGCFTADFRGHDARFEGRNGTEGSPATSSLLYGSRPERGVLGSLYTIKIEYFGSPCI